MIEINDLIDGKIKYSGDVPVLTRCQIDTAAQKILEQYTSDRGENQNSTDVDYLVEQVFGLTLDYQILQPDGSILGETIFQDGYRTVFDLDTFDTSLIQVKPGTIILDATMSEEINTRTLFTEAHELGHWLMHYLFYSATTNRACRSHITQRLFFPHYQAKSPIEWTEWQANTFAAAILLPRSALRSTLRDFLSENHLSWKGLSDFREYRNRVKYVELLERIGKIYCVSRETARIRMNKLCDIHFPNY